MHRGGAGGPEAGRQAKLKHYPEEFEEVRYNLSGLSKLLEHDADGGIHISGAF